MHSNYLRSLSPEAHSSLINCLHQKQGGECFICQKDIDLSVQTSINIDHIIPLANGGKDNDPNFALTHETCNKSKQDADLRIARVLAVLNDIKSNVKSAQSNSNASLKDVLKHFGGNLYNFNSSYTENTFKYSFDKLDENVYETKIFKDKLSHEKTVFISVPIQYLHHDDFINPRPINNSIGKLVKEFFVKNPQLHLSLARIDNGKIKIFDGQHKAVAQLLLGSKELVVRLFINPDIKRLVTANTNAGSSLRQIAFDKAIMRQLHNTLYADRIKNYQEAHGVEEDDYSFSEQELVSYFKGENIKRYIIDSVKNRITHSQENKLQPYINFEGRAKELPISYSTFEKTFLSLLLDSKKIFSTPINDKIDTGENPRELEHKQMIQLLNIIAEEIYNDKFSPEIGISKIENKIIGGKGADIPDVHLIAYRLSKEEIMYNWIIFLREIIKNHFGSRNKRIENSDIMHVKYNDELWKSIRNYIRNLRELPVWKDRNKSSTIFSGKVNYDFWKTIFETGSTPDGVPVLTKPLDFIDMAIDDYIN